MQELYPAASSRRAFLKTSAILAGAVIVPGCVPSASRREVAAPSLREQLARTTPPPVPTPLPAQPKSITAPNGVRPELFQRAMASLDRHSKAIAKRDRIAIVDFDESSSAARFQFIDLGTGKTSMLLVSHGSGSDPAHTGYLKRFSNEPNSNATCEGAFLTSDYYVGKHGRSQRLIGLDPTNDNALARAIVIHGAWYANPEMLKTHGKLGRSQGCFAVGEKQLQHVFDHLGEGRMIFAGKV